jgi:hypothetical protein
MNMKTFAVGVIIISTVLMSTTTNDVFAKGLKVYLTVDSNQRSQDATISTYQYDRVVDTRLDWIEQGITQLTLNYQEDQADNGEFRICVTLNDGPEGCGNGYDVKEKKPENIYVNIHRMQVLLGNKGNSQSQSQSSNNQNENNNALSQSQKTKIIICTAEKGCSGE